MIRRLVAPALAVSLCALLPASGTTSAECPESVAHRGLSQSAPENTLAAVYAAAASGVDYVEMDVRFTVTDVPVLMHDGRLERTTTGTGYISHRTWTYLTGLDAGDWFSPVYDAERVPTWYQALNTVRPFTADVLVEIKGNPTAIGIATFVQRITNLGMIDRVVVSAFNPVTLAAVHKQAPSLPLALLASPIHADPVAATQAAKAVYYMPEHSKLTADQVTTLHAAGVKVIPWVADTPAAWRRLTDLGVDGIVTNQAAVFEGWSAAYCG